MITLAIYIGLNAVFLVVSNFISPLPIDDIFLVVSILFSPIINTPEFILIAIGDLITSFDLIVLLSFLALIIPPLVAVIIGARLGDTGKISFLSWFLTAVISSIVFLLLAILGQDAYDLWYLILLTIIPGVINGFFYGCFSFLFSKD